MEILFHQGNFPGNFFLLLFNKHPSLLLLLLFVKRLQNLLFIKKDLKFDLKILDYHLDLMMKIEMMIMLLLMMMTLAIKKIDKNWKWNLINLNHHHHGKFFCLLKIPLTFTMFASLSNGLINSSSSSSKNKTYRLKSLTITFIQRRKKIDNFPLLFFKWNKSFYTGF